MRCKAIRRAIKAYNAAATALTPPKAELSWDTVSHYAFIEEVDILRDTSDNVTEKDWARPVGRTILKQWRRIQRAHEELARCHIEARRQHTFICDEELLFVKVLEDMRQCGDPWYGPIEEYCQRRRAANASIMAWLERMYDLDEYGGNKEPGSRTDGIASHIVDGMMVTHLPTMFQREVDEVNTEVNGTAELDEDEEAVEEAISSLIDFILDLTV